MDENTIVANSNDKAVDERTYIAVRSYVVAAQKQVSAAINYAMVNAYWNIGKQIYEACGESERAEYGKNLLQSLSEKLTAEFGKGFTVANLRNMRQFFLAFQNRNAVRSELSWTHYRIASGYTRRCPVSEVLYRD